MKKWLGLLAVLVSAIAIAIANYYRWRDRPEAPSTDRTYGKRKRPRALPDARSAGSCRSSMGMPDPECTPGAADATVTQENIRVAICVKGYTKRVRPSAGYTTSLKRQQIREYGFE